MKKVNYPVQNVAHIKSDSKLSEINVYDITGNLLSKVLSNNYAIGINLKTFVKGIYFAQIKFENGSIASKKISIQ